MHAAWNYGDWKRLGQLLVGPLFRSARDLLPIMVVVGFFQTLVFRQPIDNFSQLLIGVALVIVGLALFVSGLEMGLFPIGEGMAHEFARKGSVPWLVLFAFALGFGTTFAEPALIAISEKAAALRALEISAEAEVAAQESFALALRTTVAIAVGLALVIGVIRILKGWPLHLIIISGYALVLVLTLFAPQEMVAIAYDSGGITTSTITVPLTAALGIGLANSIQGRNPLLDGFGLIALASLTPILLVLLFGIYLGGGQATNQDYVSVNESFPLSVQSPEAVAVNQPDSVGKQLRKSVVSTISDVLPITLVIAFFQGVVLRRPIANLPRRLWGAGFVILGLAFFLVGLQLALFPLGESMAQQLTSGFHNDFSLDEAGRRIAVQPAWHAFYWTYIFAFAIGASTAIAEPALIAVSMKAQEVSGGTVPAWGLRLAVACGVGLGVAIGTFRIVTGTGLPYYILAGYTIVMVQTYFAPRMIIPIAYDSGGVATSTVTVPLVAALGLGLASNLPDRHPVVDGFGMIAVAVLMPIISVMGYAQFAAWWNRKQDT